MSESEIPSMAVAAARAAHRPAYLAWVFAQYAAAEGKTAGELGESLGVTGTDFPRLALCLRPRAKHFAADVHAIATHCRADATVLAQVVRHVEVLQGMAMGETHGMPKHGLLMAARARRKTVPQKQERK